LNVVEYHLSADAKLADAAEVKAREKGLAREKGSSSAGGLT
jgi:hypothetical protein